MLGSKARPIFNSHNLLFQLVVACGVGLLLGIAALRSSPLWTLGALVGGGLVYAILKRPEIALLGILVATSSIVFENQLPLVSIGVGSLHIPDLFLLASLGLIVLRWLVEPDFKIVRTPLDGPLLIFVGVAMLSTFIAVFQSSVEIEEARRAIRVAAYYLTFFAVTNLVREDRQLRFLLRGLLLLATIVAVVMTVQFVLGESIQILPGSVETLRTAGEEYSGVTRIVTPGRSLILVAFIATTAALSLNAFRPITMLKSLQWGLLGLAVVLTFLRSYWVVASVVLSLLAYLVRPQDRQRLIGWGLVVLYVAAIVLLSAFVEPESEVARLVRAASARLGTLGSSETLEEDSLQWRNIENQYAVRQIASHPLLGLGLGARYRPLDPRLDYWGTEWDARSFIHNGHLWVLLTTGALGYISLMWLSVAFLIRGFRYWRRVSDSQTRGIVLAFTLAYLGVLIAALVESVFMAWCWSPLIGIMMGVNEVALRRALQEDSVG